MTLSDDSTIASSKQWTHRGNLWNIPNKDFRFHHGQSEGTSEVVWPCLTWKFFTDQNTSTVTIKVLSTYHGINHHVNMRWVWLHNFAKFANLKLRSIVSQHSTKFSHHENFGLYSNVLFILMPVGVFIMLKIQACSCLPCIFY